MEDALTDAQLLSEFAAGTIGGDAFPHARHVRVAWLLARAYGPDEGLRRLEAGIREVARRAGRPGAFHVTITRAWFELVAPVDDLAEHPAVFDKTLLDRYYSPGRLAAGRDRWLDPDLHPLRLPPPPKADVSVASTVGRIPTAVAVLATNAEHTVRATTVSWIASVSRTPPLVSVSLANRSRMLELLGRADAFTLSVLASGQAALAERFADRARSEGRGQFADVPHHMTAYGPVIDGAAVRIGCRLHARHPCGDHTIVIGEIRSADAHDERHPLVQYDGRY